ncbi:MAG: restriction endonuclease subunit S [Candidatus Hydrogenedentes bacterium]|nr:restriction endonuclease subunit S [Candidatus Hydrogenedentota bacterium]
MKKTATYTKKRHTYPAYKDSGIEWLGEIPEHWEVKRLKHSVALVNQKVDAENCNLPYTGLEQIESWTGKRVLSEGMVSSEGQASLYRKGDVLFGKLRPYLAKVLSVSESGICTGELLVLRPVYVLQQFLLGYLLNPDVISIVDSSTYGAKMPRANWDFIGNLPVVVPSTDEQRAIAAFLDRETVRIDGLIEKKQRQIELLQEKRAALISHAVTKGLNPNAKMKDSGIEWLGEIPEHWEVKRLRHITPRLGVGLVINPSTYVDEKGDVPFFLGSNVEEFKLIPESARRITQESNLKLNPSRLQEGDIVTVRVGAPGISAVVPPELDGSNCASIMITRRSKTFVSHWLCYVFNSAWGKYQVERVAYGAAQKQFNISHAVNFVYPVPPLEEQNAVVNVLDHETNRINNLITQVEESIALLREYRTALISSTVTGKIDVRGENA